MNPRVEDRSWLPYVSDLLYLLNLGLAVTNILRVYLATVPPYRSKLSDFASRTTFWLDAVLDLRPRKYSLVGFDVLCLLILVAVTIILLLVLRITPQNVKDWAVGVLGIPVALLSVPITVLGMYYTLHPYLVLPKGILMLYDTTFFYWFELAVAAVGLVLGSARLWPFPPSVTATLLAIHFSLWDWWMWHLDDFTAVWAVPLLLTPPALAWVLFEKRRREPCSTTASK